MFKRWDNSVEGFICGDLLHLEIAKFRPLSLKLAGREETKQQVCICFQSRINAETKPIKSNYSINWKKVKSPIKFGNRTVGHASIAGKISC